MNKKLALVMRLDTTEGFLEGTSIKYTVEPKDYPVKTLGELQEMVEDAKKVGNVLTYKLEMVDESEIGMAYTKSKEGRVYRVDKKGNCTRVEGGAF